VKQRHQTTKEEMRAEIRAWAARIGVAPKRIQIQPMTTKWASCSRGKRISFNSELLGESREFREVVIVHELLHLSVPNHGKLFKSLMNAFLPNWEANQRGRAGGNCTVR
jgi:predicted metal-dependent hydrolase